MIARIWHGRTPATKSDEYPNLMRTVAIPDYRSTPGNKAAYALRRKEGDTVHFLMITFWEKPGETGEKPGQTGRFPFFSAADMSDDEKTSERPVCPTFRTGLKQTP